LIPFDHYLSSAQCEEKFDERATWHYDEACHIDPIIVAGIFVESAIGIRSHPFD
jgi:hypothetical protein